jgi:two-component system response regulator
MADEKILLVEDSADDEALTLMALERNKISTEVIVARDGLEALGYLIGEGGAPVESLADLPKVVLLDLKLPRVDGHEVLRRLRSHPRTHLLPIVVLTTSSEDEDKLNAYSAGANSYVRKPVDFREFTSTVGQLGAYWLEVNDSPPI